MRPFRLMFVFLLMALAACGGQTPPTPAPIDHLASRPTVAPAPTEAAPTEPTAVPAAPTEAAVPTEPAAAPTEQPAATEPAPAGAVLPAPLYFLSPVGEVSQIFRLETDGATQTQVTDEAAGVLEFDVSPADGRLAYISDNDLIVAEGHGAGRKVIVDGAPVDLTDVNDAHENSVTTPVWSPDGQRIAYGLRGVNLIRAVGGAPGLIQPSVLQSDPGMAEMFKYSHLYFPFAWSPDGTKLLTTFSYVPESGGYTVVDLESTAAITLTSDEGFLCCNPIWSQSGSTVYFANHMVGIVAVGMWESDAASGQTTRLFGTADGAAPWSLISTPLPVGNDAFLAFYQQTADESVANDPGNQQLVMTQINADGTTAPLRSEPSKVGEVLWAPDGSGAVVSEQSYDASRLSWLPSDGSPAVDLQSLGKELHWGQ
jgi:Tol biopolymer transport system component